LVLPRRATFVALSTVLAFGLLLTGVRFTGAQEQAPSISGTITDCARVRPGGLLALYDFQASTGDVVRDRSGTGKPLDLRISNPKAVRRSRGSIELHGKTLIRSETPATRIIEAIRRSGEVTVETWIRPENTTQKGPARIVSLARNLSERNLTLGQNGDHFEVRLRSTRTNANGLPALKSKNGTLTTKRTHAVYTRDRFGRARLYLEGKLSKTRIVAGTLSNWRDTFELSLGSEVNKGRPWRGTLYRVALYDRALNLSEVARHFDAGPDAPPSIAAAANPPTKPGTALGAELFEQAIAPLLARHCLECHDTATKKGRLDLSNRTAALAGGRTGPGIVPGKAAESLVWRAVTEGDMPKKRPALSTAEQHLLREWIDAGATWSRETIDSTPTHRTRSTDGNWLQRLTVEEYVATVRSAVGVDVTAEARDLMPPDLRADGFSNTAYNLNVDLGLVDAYAQLASIIVDRMDTVAFAARFSKSQRLTDDSMRDLIAKMGLWLLRGPLAEEEITAFRGISTTVASAGGGFPEAADYVVEAMLQSPRFVYRVENQHGDGTASPVSDYELASRLSYILWGSAPDKELMRAVEDGRLYDCTDVRAQVDRMLEDPCAVERSGRFIYEWLDLGRLDHLRPNADHFPHWDARLAADMREETLAFFREVVWTQKRPLIDLLNAQVTWLTPRLAKHYNLTGQHDRQTTTEQGGNDKEPASDGGDLSEYDLAKVPERGGLLTHGSVLTIGGDEASMVSRGLFVLRDLLRSGVKDPPPCVDTTPIPTQPGLTQRSIAEERIANPSCGGCHAKFEPLAFGLERFDGLGTYHVADEHGNALRDDGEVLFPNTEDPIAYSSSAELMNLLAASTRVQECLTWKVTQFALGRPLYPADAPILGKIHEAAREGGGTYASVMTAVVMSELVQLTHTEKAP
jgi:hypothetical protein